MNLAHQICPFESTQVCTFLLSITPVFELRASIPIGVLSYNLPVWEVLMISFAGVLGVSMLTYCSLWYFMPIIRRHIPLLNRFIEKIFEHTRKKHSKKMKILGDMALIAFIAVPLPGSGGFTGALLCYLFGARWQTTLFLLSIGIFLSALIVMGVTLFGRELYEFLNAVW